MALSGSEYPLSVGPCTFVLKTVRTRHAFHASRKGDRLSSFVCSWGCFEEPVHSARLSRFIQRPPPKPIPQTASAVTQLNMHRG